MKIVNEEAFEISGFGGVRERVLLLDRRLGLILLWPRDRARAVRRRLLVHHLWRSATAAARSGRAPCRAMQGGFEAGFEVGDRVLLEILLE